MGTTRLTTSLINEDTAVELTGLSAVSGTISLSFKNLTNPARATSLEFRATLYYDSSLMD